MADANRPVHTYADSLNPAERSRAERSARVETALRTPMTTTGPLFDSRDIAALVAAAIMNLGPLAMAAFWAPYH